tara:strand:+ start:360 stop:485 length:126 start_codon:yes stop_codon:yes gene_type:complete
LLSSLLLLEDRVGDGTDVYFGGGAGGAAAAAGSSKGGAAPA